MNGQYILHFWANQKNILQKQLSQHAILEGHLNKYGSYFKFILLLSGDINLNPGPTTPKRNDILWELLPFFFFHNCSFSTERMDYQLGSLSAVSNDAWNVFRKRGTHFIHLNINSLLSKTFQKLSDLGGSKCFARKKGLTWKEEGWCRNGGVATFLLLYSSITINLCVGKVKFPLLLFFQSFELAMQDSHPSLYGTKRLYHLYISDPFW